MPTETDNERAMRAFLGIRTQPGDGRWGEVRGMTPRGLPADLLPVVDRIELAVAHFGGVRAAARGLGVQSAAISRVRRGLVRPTPSLLRALGMCRRVVYEPALVRPEWLRDVDDGDVS